MKFTTKYGEIKKTFNNASRIKIIGYTELHTDFNLKAPIEYDSSEGLSIDTFVKCSKIRFIDLNLMQDENISFKNKSFTLYFDDLEPMTFLSSNELYPTLDSRYEKEYDKIISLIVNSKTLKIKTHLNTYAIYEISFFYEIPPKNRGEVENRIEERK